MHKYVNDSISPREYIEKMMGIVLQIHIAEQINNNSAIVTLPAGYTVVREGEKAYSSYFILQGVVRGYYIDEQGNDITKCFSSEGDFFSSEGLRTDKESSFTIECLENCKCIKFSYEFIRQIVMHNDDLREIINERYYQEVEKLEVRAKSLILMSAEERYNDFCTQYPILQNRIALKYIASYIGVRAASLSRIRKNIRNSY